MMPRKAVIVEDFEPLQLYVPVATPFARMIYVAQPIKVMQTAPQATSCCMATLMGSTLSTLAVGQEECGHPFLPSGE